MIEMSYELIPREKAIEAIRDLLLEPDSIQYIFSGDAIGVVQNVPSVPAVPLEPLCQWLAGYATPPKYALDEVCDDSIDPESLVYTANDRVKAWEFHFRELLKSGLMDTEGEDEKEKA